MLARQQAATVAGVAAKLRAALLANTGDPRVEGAVLCSAPLASFAPIFDEALRGNDYTNECIWTAIVSLERMESHHDAPNSATAVASGSKTSASARTVTPTGASAIAAAIRPA